MEIVLLLIWRGVRLRCPRCGQGKLYRRLITMKMYERCQHCDWRFEREEGYWTGAMALDLVVAELVAAAYVVTATVVGAPLVPELVIGLLLAALLPIVLYPHAHSLWMTIDFMLHPTPLL